MYLYLIFACIVLISFFELNLGKRRSVRILILPILLFFGLSFLRWERGTDWVPYYYMFRFIDSEYYKTTYEFLFYNLNVLIRSVTENYTYLLLAQAMLIYPIYHFVIKKYSLAPFVSVMVWFAVSLGSIFFTRQTVAVSLTFLAFHFIVERKLWYFLIAVIIGTLFHRTAIIFLPAYYIYTLNLSRKQVVILIAVSFGFSFIAQQVFSLLAAVDLSVISDKSDIYLKEGTSKNYGSSFSPLETMLRGLGYRLIFIVLTFIFYSLYEQDGRYRGIFNLYLTGVILFITFVPISVAMIRFSVYYETLQILMFPYFVLYYRHKIVRNVFLLAFSLYFLLRTDSLISSYEDLYIPYKSIFNKELPVKVY